MRLPEGWSLMPRSSSYLMAGRLREDIQYPRIILTVEENASLSEVTADNVESFAATLREELKDEELIEPVTPVKIGDLHGAAYAKRGRVGQTVLERLFLVTAHHGRRYILELRAFEGTMRGFRPQAHAVAAHLNFEPEGP